LTPSTAAGSRRSARGRVPHPSVTDRTPRGKAARASVPALARSRRGDKARALSERLSGLPSDLGLQYDVAARAISTTEAKVEQVAT
jgi:hypothetical protein